MRALARRAARAPQPSGAMLRSAGRVPAKGVSQGEGVSQGAGVWRGAGGKGCREAARASLLACPLPHMARAAQGVLVAQQRAHRVLVGLDAALLHLREQPRRRVGRAWLGPE